MSGIVINIKAGATFEESSVTATEEQVNIIADSERAAFDNGSEADLMKVVKAYFGGKPTNAYLHSPTPWNDLYKTYRWSEVQRVLRPKKAELLKVTTKPTIVVTKTLKNESNKKATFTTSISEQVSNTVSNEWTNSNSVSVGQPISYGVDFLGGESTYNYTHDWGHSETVSQKTILTTDTSVTVDLNPGQSAIVELTATSGKMRIRIIYEACLKGQTAVNYKDTHKGHHFWGLYIDQVLSGSNKVQIIEDVEVGFYSNAYAIVRDEETMERMIFYMADHPDEPPSDE